ncbi:MAG: hypothetical protein WAM60_06485, partial [Candidatus Promineifilaceae bacterium]
IQENGLYFPRSELFGFTLFGQETQLFLREIDLVLKYRCYAYPAAETPLQEGQLIETIYLPDGAVTEPIPTKRPSDVPFLLSKSAVRWFKRPT